MICEYNAYSGRWLATGNGPLRPIIAEGNTRQEATRGWMAAVREQMREKKQ